MLRGLLWCSSHLLPATDLPQLSTQQHRNPLAGDQGTWSTRPAHLAPGHPAALMLHFLGRTATRPLQYWCLLLPFLPYCRLRPLWLLGKDLSIIYPSPFTCWRAGQVMNSFGVLCWMSITHRVYYTLTVRICTPGILSVVPVNFRYGWLTLLPLEGSSGEII